MLFFKNAEIMSVITVCINTLWTVKDVVVHLYTYNFGKYWSIFITFFTVVSRMNFYTYEKMLPHLNIVLTLPCENGTPHFILVEHHPLHQAKMVWNIKFIKYRENKLIVTKYVLNVRLWHEHKHARVLGIGQLHHQSATAPCSTTHTVDAVSAHRCHKLWSHAHVAEWQTKWHNPMDLALVEFGGHMSGAMKSGVVRRSSSIMSRVRCAGALSCWKIKCVVFTSQIKLTSKQLNGIFSEAFISVSRHVKIV